MRRGRTSRGWRTQAGFTLGDVLSGLSVFSVVAAAITSVVVSTFTSTGYQARVSDAQLDVATGMALLQDDLRAAGYIPDIDNFTQNVFQQLVSGTTSDSIQFVGDVNADNVWERITYAVTPTADTTKCPPSSWPCLMRTQDQWDGAAWTPGTPQPVAANVTIFTLKFYLINPCNPGPAPTPPAALTLQTATQVLTPPQNTTFVSVQLTGSGTYKGQTVTRTLTSDVAVRQSNVLPTC